MSPEGSPNTSLKCWETPCGDILTLSKTWNGPHAGAGNFTFHYASLHLTLSDRVMGGWIFDNALSPIKLALVVVLLTCMQKSLVRISLFSQSFQENATILPELDQYWFLPHPCQFIIHKSSYYSRLSEILTALLHTFQTNKYNKGMESAWNSMKLAFKHVYKEISHVLKSTCNWE